jgi:hypothetical protein
MARKGGSAIKEWLILDSGVVDLRRSYNPIFVTLSSLKPLLCHGLKIRSDAWTTGKHKTPESNQRE